MRVNVPTIDVAADVVPVGVDATGVLEVPEDPSVLGWWSSGAVPGSLRGTTVVAAHMDATGRGTGAMARLIDAPIGTRIDVVTADGAHVSYQITERRSYAKDEGLPRDLFRSDGAPRLVLITCGERSTGPRSTTPTTS
ncbi:Sortase family protein [Promicromonospora umidemergens]|uniref:Sortase family protein n=1 Tax=Promicromonospora umidemergens TaxID=629679 RepID=A0ABP8WYN6_9MICO|nr:class F sortase [Promicromonospora umidemergens]MCP2287044.1 Sortase family protein [Promicromonospora umidemergens]